MSILLWINLGCLGATILLNTAALICLHRRQQWLYDGLLDHYRHIKMLRQCEEIGTKALAGIEQRVDRLEIIADFARAAKAEAKP